MLNLLFPVFELVRIPGSLLPAWVVIVVLTSAVSWLSVWLYKLASPQDRLADIKNRSKELTASLLKDSDAEFDQVAAMAKANVVLSLKRLGYTLPGFVAALVPLLSLYLWCERVYAVEWPGAGETVEMGIAPGDAEIAVTGANARRTDEGAWTFVADGSGELTITTDDGTPVLSAKTSRIAPVYAKIPATIRLLGHSERPLPDDNPVDRIEFGLPEREYLPFGPSWLRSWMIVFLLPAVAASLAARKVMKVV